MDRSGPAPPLEAPAGGVWSEQPAVEPGAMAFRWYRPARLVGLVEAIWEQRSERASTWRILPSGSVEFLVRLGPAFSLRSALRITPETTAIRQRCFLSGLHTRPLDMAYTSFHMFGAQLHPAAVPALFGLPCSEVLDGALEADRLVRELDRLVDGLRAAPAFEARAHLMETWLEARLGRSDRSGDALRMRRLAAHLPVFGAVSAGEVVRRLGYSRSHAHRLFGEWFGQSATGTIRMGRFVRAVEALHGPHRSLTEVGLGAGYYDQSHFIRDFRAFADLTPGEYRARRGATPGHLAV